MMQFKLQIEVDGEWYAMDWEMLCETIAFGNDLKHCRKRFWTGLKDKNGVEVFHKDFVKDESGRIWLIEWDEHNAKFVRQLQEKKKKFDGRIGPYTAAAQDYTMEMMEVIGNIYEHPELLTK